MPTDTSDEAVEKALGKCDHGEMCDLVDTLLAERAKWRELVALYAKNISDLSGLHIIRGMRQTASDDVILRCKELRKDLDIQEPD